MADEPTKICRTCGRPFGWRAKWARHWDQVMYCSKDCQGGPSKLSSRLEKELLALVVARGRQKSACPSEAVRALFGDKEHWPPQAMRDVRYAVNRLADKGALVVLQQGRVQDAPAAKGPIRVRRA